MWDAGLDLDLVFLHEHGLVTGPVSQMLALRWPCTSSQSGPLSFEIKLCSLGCSLHFVNMWKHPKVHLKGWNLISFPSWKSPRKGTWPHMAKWLGKFLRVYSRTALWVLRTTGSCGCGLACRLSCLTYAKFGGLGAHRGVGNTTVQVPNWISKIDEENNFHIVIPFDGYQTWCQAGNSEQEWWLSHLTMPQGSLPKG